MMKLGSARKGFTLIELLVVIAIIGILSSVVLASLGTARAKARDATRVSDIKNIQLALELYYDANQSYPANADATAGEVDISDAAAGTNIEGKLTGFGGTAQYLPSMPNDPQTAARPPAEEYHYVGLVSPANLTECTAAGGCGSYALGAGLENIDNPVLDNDIEGLALAGVFVSLAANGCEGAAGADGAGERCYSVRP